MNDIDIKTSDLTTVKEILSHHVADRTVWAFGSRITGKAKKFSDLDIVILGEKPLPLSRISKLSEDFTESNLPFKVDIVDWASTKKNFREIIEKDYVVVQNSQ